MNFTINFGEILTGAITILMYTISRGFNGMWTKIWWKFVPGVTIVVPWPTGEILTGLIFSADPNDWYRPWLEEHVGKQGWDWDWTHVISQNSIRYTSDGVCIKFRKAKASFASLAALRWS